MGRPIPEIRNVQIQPIVDWWQTNQPQHQRSACVCTLGGWCASVESLARRVGVSHSTMYRRLRTGTLGIYEADHWAVRVGFHPNRIWPVFDRVGCQETHAASEWDEVVL